MSITSDHDSASLALADYYRAFSTLDVHAISPHFHEPCLIIGPQGVFSAPTRSAVAAAFTPVVEGFRNKGFERSELSLRQLKSLSPATILATGVAIRFKADGQELDRVGVTYVLRKADNRWKIAVLITHDAIETARAE